MRKNRAMIAVIGVSVIVLVLIGFLVFQTYSFASTEFIDDGYVLTTVSENTPDDTVNAQHYFNKGTKFTKKYPEKVVFKNVDGDKVSLDTKNFLHYQSGSMSGLTKSVILDTDKLDAEQISYYSVSNKSMLEITGKDYQVSNGGEMVSFSNFVWKISDSQYMVVSDEVKLYVSENEQKVFDNYVELQYKDEGVVYLVNQEGTYSTVSSDAYLELNNGIQIFLGSKNISDGEVVLVNMAQMVIDSDDNIEIIPDEEYKNENLDTPTINIDVEDGEPGLDGDEGQQGEQGEAGTPGDPGETGENGNNGNNGNNGSNGVAGSPGTPGGPGKPGDPGNQGESADNSDVIFNPETMPQFSAVLTTKPYGVNANVTYDNNGCAVSEVSASIIEKSSGAFVWGQNLGVPEAQFELNCDTLKQNTEYVFVISAAYSSPNSTTGEMVTQDVYKKLFVTDDLGVKLEKRYSTQEAIVLNLTKTAGSAISSVRVKYFDENMNFKGYGAPLGIAQGEYSGIFDITKMQEGESVPVQFGGLEHNKAYYMQIEVRALTDITDVNIIPTNSFPVQKFMTLKIPPEIGKPKVTLSERTNSFTIEPSYVTDPDNGIMYYRYEIYEAGDIVANPDEEPDTPTEGEEQPGTVTTPVDNTNPSLDNMLSYMDNLNISTNEEGETVIEKKENSEEQSGDGTSAEGEADSMVNIMAEPEDEPSGDTAGEPSTGDQTGESSGEPPADVTDQTGDEDWLSSLSTEEKEELLQSFQQFDDEKKTVLTSLAPMAKGTAGTSYTIKGTPVYTAEKETAAKIDVPIDGTKIRRETDYVVRIIGVFYDNEGIIEYSSPLSDVFRAGASMWPSVSNQIQDGYLTASTAEGTIYVTDSTGVIQGELWIEVASSTEINGSIRKSIINFALEDIKKGEGYYELPYDLKALKSQQPYTISVYAKKMVINDSISDVINNKVYTDVVVGNASFTTTDYSPLLIKENEATSQETSGHSFVAKLSLQPDNFDNEAELRTKLSKVKGLGNMGDFSAKSLTSVFFELYKEKENGSGPEETPFTLLGHPVGHAAIKGISDDVVHNAQEYAFNSSLYENGYLRDEASVIDDFSIVLDESSFGMTTDDFADYERDYVYIKVVGAYDYTYGRGGNDPIYGNNNIVTIGKSNEFDGDDSINDKYVKVAVHPIVPPFPGKLNNNKRNYNRIDELIKNDAKIKINSGAQYGRNNSNVDSNDDLDGRWDELDDSTAVGVVIQGPTSLAKYSKSVTYYIYDKTNTRVAVSENLPVEYDRNDSNKQQLPEWTYFLEKDTDTGTAPIKRGEIFYVETKVVLKYIDSPKDPNKKMLYPDEAFSEKIKDSCILDKEEPRFNIIPWEGDAAAASSKDILYFTYKDVDKALSYKNNSVAASDIDFYYVNAGGGRGSFTDSSIEPISSIGGTKVTGYYCLKATLPGNGTLAVDYKLKETDKKSEKKELFSENNVIKEKNVTIAGEIECVVNSKTTDSNTMSFEFSVPFQSSSPENLARVDIDFSPASTTGETKTVELKNREFEIKNVTEQDGTQSYWAVFTVKASELYTLAGASVINYTVMLYYDDGKYGLKYASTAEADHMDNPYYALQGDSGLYKDIYLRDSLFERKGFTINSVDKTIYMTDSADVKYLDTGMDYMPKSLSGAEKSGTIHLPYVVPEAFVEVVPGLISARIDAKFSGNNTLVDLQLQDNTLYNAELRYGKAGTYKSTWTTKPIKINNNIGNDGQHVEVPLENLTPGTSYEFEILGNVFTENESTVVKKYIFENGTFKTNPEISIGLVNGDEIPDVTFIADLKERTKKTARVAFTLKKIFKKDLDCVGSISLKIKSTTEMDSEGKPLTVSEKIVDVDQLNKWFASQAGEDNLDSQLNLSCSADLSWSPDTNHKMDAETRYTIEAKVNYSNELVDSVTPVSAQITPSPWQNQPKFFITSKASSNRDSNHIDTFSIQFDISGNDKNRVIAGEDSKTGTLVLQLVNAQDNNNPVVNSIRTIEVEFDEYGLMQSQSVTYDSPGVCLTADTTYKLMVHYITDYENVNLKSAGADEEGIRHNETYVSANVTTPKSASASINSMVLLPKEGGGEVTIAGVNLENTEIIKYTLRDNTDKEDYLMVTYSMNDGTLTNNFKMQQPGITWNQYVLNVPELNDPTHSYAITVEFWEKDSAKPVESKTAIYGNQSQNGIMASLTRLFSSWLS